MVIPCGQPFQNPRTLANRPYFICMGVWIGWPQGFAGQTVAIPYGQPLQKPVGWQNDGVQSLGELYYLIQMLVMLRNEMFKLRLGNKNDSKNSQNDATNIQHDVLKTCWGIWSRSRSNADSQQIPKLANSYPSSTLPLQQNSKDFPNFSTLLRAELCKSMDIL